jgi:hypothetical protein
VAPPGPSWVIGKPPALDFDQGVKRALEEARRLLAERQHPVARRAIHGKDQVAGEESLRNHHALGHSEGQIELGVELRVHEHHQPIQRVPVVDGGAQFVQPIQQRSNFTVAEFGAQLLLGLGNQVAHADRVLLIVGRGAMCRQGDGQRRVAADYLNCLDVLTIHKEFLLLFL